MGIPVGRKEFVEHDFESRADTHAELLEKIFRVKDCSVHGSFSLLYCGVSRGNFFIRTVGADHSLHFSQRHEEQVGVASPL